MCDQKLKISRRIHTFYSVKNILYIYITMFKNIVRVYTFYYFFLKRVNEYENKNSRFYILFIV
jgi:hypothetical protein